jgi:hypothetical protein
MKTNINRKAITASLFAFVLAAVPAATFAANSTLNQTINPGVLATGILDDSRNPVGTPAVAMSAKNFSFECQNGVDSSTGTLGTNTERLYVSNADAADNGFTLALAATDGATATWSNGGAETIDFNDSASAGCTDGADGDTAAGQLTVDPAGTLTTDCAACTTTGTSTGTLAAFSQGTTDSVTLLNAGATSDDVWRGYLTGVNLSQAIPAETQADSYTLNLTLTATAQ